MRADVAANASALHCRSSNVAGARGSTAQGPDHARSRPARPCSVRPQSWLRGHVPKLRQLANARVLVPEDFRDMTYGVAPKGSDTDWRLVRSIQVTWVRSVCADSKLAGGRTWV